MRSRGSERSCLGIDEQFLRFCCALGITSPSDSRVRHTLLCFKTGWLRCRPERGGSRRLEETSRESTRRRSEEARLGRAPIQSYRRSDSRAPRLPRETGGRTPRSLPRPATGRLLRGVAETTPLPLLPTSGAAGTDPHATRGRGSAPGDRSPRVESTAGLTCGLNRFPADGFTSY